MDANIGGVYMWVYVVGLVVLGVVYFLFSNWWEARTAMKKAGGNHILVLFHTTGGQAYFKWCTDERGELSPVDMKGYDQKTRTMAKNAIGKIRAEKQAFGWYFILPDHVFGIGYPFTKPRVTARLASYVENYPAPRVTANLEKWTSEEYVKVTSALAQASKDTTDIEAIISQAAGIEEKLGALLEVPNQLRSQKMWLYISCGIGALTAYFVFSLQDKIGKIATQLGVAVLQWFGIGG
jgi:hypothetical protein